MQIADLSARRYGRLVVTSFAGTRNGRAYWRCICDCGSAPLDVMGRRLQNGMTISCGCRKKETLSRLRHGSARHGATTPEYAAWSNMKYRCNNATAPNYGNYGGRGIRVCARWNDSFEAFLEDMGLRPAGNFTIDRIDNDGNYEPGNVRWAPSEDQVLNKRTNHVVTVRGVTLPLREAVRRFAPHAKHRTVRSRLKRGWDIERALFSPTEGAAAGGEHQRRQADKRCRPSD